MDFDWTQLGMLWSAWLNGKITPFQYSGISSVWWARFAKIAQFAGAATVVLEIIGPARIRKFSEGIQNLAGQGTYTFTEAVDISDSWGEMIERLQFVVGGTVFFMLLTLYFWAAEWNSLGAIIGNILMFFAILIMSASAAVWAFFVLGLGGTLLIRTAATVISTLVLRPIAFVLGNRRLDQFVKLFAFTTLIFGFHFDLLTS